MNPGRDHCCWRNERFLAGMNVRPHPGPLPQPPPLHSGAAQAVDRVEEERRRKDRGNRRQSEFVAATAKESSGLSEAISSPSLSPGERDGVRASVSTKPLYSLATRSDDAGIRRLLRENPMPGQIAFSLEREPDYFADGDLAGEEKQTIVACESKRVVCVG